MFVKNKGMYTIEVVNKRTHKPTPHDFYCGRPNLLGNIYTHIPKGTLAEYVVETRSIAIQKYTPYFYEKLQKNEAFRNEFNKIYDHLVEHKIVYLLCWCFPKSCHCDIIKEELQVQLRLNKK